MNNLYEIQYLDIKPDEKYDEIISKVVKECFRVENLLDSKLYISITLTTPEEISNNLIRFFHTTPNAMLELVEITLQ